jgi:ABC-type nitrate/sulfonate/bicarbonate transport system ATPase subunit
MSRANGGGSETDLLVLQGLEVAYGAIPAVRGADLRVGRGEIVAMLGANGAGKSSTLGAIAGLVPGRGRVELDRGTGGERLAPGGDRGSVSDPRRVARPAPSPVASSNNCRSPAR